jgi:DNA-binding transcriptional ArsR family regulator
MPSLPSQSDAILAALASPRRRRILKLVWDAERSAGEIAATFDVTWPATSQNLRVLRDSGLLDERREGTKRFYRANHKALGNLQSFLVQMWEQDVDRLGELAEQEARERRPRG